MNEPRIFPEEVVRAYQETGIEPRKAQIRAVGVEGVVAGCALGAVALARGLWGANEHCDCYARVLGEYGDVYGIAFMYAFDEAFSGNAPYAPEPKDWYNRRQVGRYDGLRAGLKVKEGIPPLEIPDYPPVEEVTA